jgi:rubrerythrin
MKIEEAINTALTYEKKIMNVYKEALAEAKDEDGKRIFGVLAKEEGYHIKYLQERLNEWEENGTIQQKELKTAIPAEHVIKEKVQKLETRMTDKDYSDEILMLRKALDVEIQTSDFYEKMVEELEGEYKDLFARFLEIEHGHRALVQAEIDHLEGQGYWFDFPEFDLEIE